MTSVSTVNTGALVASNYASKAQKEFNKSIARLSSGQRTMYGADPAGQGVADSLNANSRSWYVAARNAEDGLSVAQTIESAVMEIASLAQRLRELGIQADNAAIQSTSDIAALDAEAAAVADAPKKPSSALSYCALSTNCKVKGKYMSTTGASVTG